MNRKLQRIFVLVLLVVFGTCLRSQAAVGYNYDVCIGGIYYKLNSTNKTASVTFIQQLVQRPMDPHMPVEIIYKSDYKGSVVIPKTIEVDNPITVAVEKEEYTVTSIDHHAFYECTGLRSVVIPATVTSIGANAFEGCTMLSSIDMPFTMESIASRAFYGCRNAKLVFPKVVKLGTDALTDSKISVGVEAYGLCFVPDKQTGTAMLIAKDMDFDEEGNVIYNRDAKYEGDLRVGGGYSINQNTESYRLVSIDDHAFTNCEVNSLYLYPSVTEIAPSAFENAHIVSVLFTSPLKSYEAFAQSEIERIFTAFSEVEKVASCVASSSCEVLSIEPEVTKIIPYLRGVSFYARSSNKYMTINSAYGVESIAPLRVGDDGFYFFKLNYMQPDTEGNVWVDYSIEGCPMNLTHDVTFTTAPFKASVQMVEQTQTSFSFKVTVSEDETWALERLVFDGKEISNGELLEYSNLFPGVYYMSGMAYYDENDISAWVDKDEYVTSFPFSKNVSTKDITFELVDKQVGPTSVSALGKYEAGNANVTGTKLVCNGIVSETNRLDMTGLEPGKKYTARYEIYVDDKLYRGLDWAFTTDTVAFVTLPAQAVSNTCAIIAAECNISEKETACGFEWRRIDAPDLVPSTFSPTFVADSTLAGRLEGLSPNTYYKYRPYYYCAANDTYYYGEWIGFGTADAYVYFEPVVYTSSDPVVEGTTVRLQGRALAGSEAVAEQGFEYWKESLPSAPMTRTAGGVQVVLASGQTMEATLEGLEPGTTYAYRAFVTTSRGTTYGATYHFSTPVLTAIGETFADSGEKCLDFSVKQSGQVEISVSAPAAQSCAYRLVSIGGQMIAGGMVPADGQWYPLAEGRTLPAGLYVVTVSDGVRQQSKKMVVE